MVQRLADPGLLPTSQEAGGTVHDQSMSMTAKGSAPGYDGGVMTYNVSTDSPAAEQPQPPVIPVSTERDRTSTVAATPKNADRWQTTSTSGGSYEGLSYNDPQGQLH